MLRYLWIVNQNDIKLVYVSQLRMLIQLTAWPQVHFERHDLVAQQDHRFSWFSHLNIH